MYSIYFWLIIILIFLHSDANGKDKRLDQRLRAIWFANKKYRTNKEIERPWIFKRNKFPLHREFFLRNLDPIKVTSQQIPTTNRVKWHSKHRKIAVPGELLANTYGFGFKNLKIGKPKLVIIYEPEIVGLSYKEDHARDLNEGSEYDEIAQTPEYNVPEQTEKLLQISKVPPTSKLQLTRISRKITQYIHWLERIQKNLLPVLEDAENSENMARHQSDLPLNRIQRTWFLDNEANKYDTRVRTSSLEKVLNSTGRFLWFIHNDTARELLTRLDKTKNGTNGTKKYIHTTWFPRPVKKWQISHREYPYMGTRRSNSAVPGIFSVSLPSLDVSIPVTQNKQKSMKESSNGKQNTDILPTIIVKYKPKAVASNHAKNYDLHSGNHPEQDSAETLFAKNVAKNSKRRNTIALIDLINEATS